MIPVLAEREELEGCPYRSCAPGARRTRVAGLPPVLAHRARSECTRWTRAVGGRPTTIENVPGDPLLFTMQRVDDGRSWTDTATFPMRTKKAKRCAQL